MTTFTVMKTTFQEESLIPNLAVQAFQEAFENTHSKACDVVYVENAQLLKKQANGQIVLIKNLPDAYVAAESKHSVFKRNSKKLLTVENQSASLA